MSPLRALAGWRARQPLTFRIVAAMLAGSLLLSGVVLAAQAWWTRRAQVAQVELDLAQIERSIVPSLVAALWAVDGPQVDRLLDGIQRLPDIRAVRLHSAEGPLRVRGPATAAGGSLREFPLRYPGPSPIDLGRLEVEIDEAALSARLREESLKIAFGQIVAIFGSAALALLLQVGWINRHLRRVAEQTRELRLDGLDAAFALDKPRSDPPDEVDRVVDALNAMRLAMRADIAARQAAEHSLKAERDSLEAQVAARTADLRAQAEELQARNGDLDAYAHSVAHDLKNPLTSIVGLATLMHAAPAQLLPQAQARSSEAILQAARRMIRIIDSLLLLGRVGREQDVRCEPIESRAMVDEVLRQLADKARGREARIEAQGPWPSVQGVPAWVEGVWVNLVSNAIKYGGQPPRIELGSDPPQGGRVRFWVRDYGPGIAADDRVRLFQPYSRLDPAAAEGHGIGLSVVKRICDRLGMAVGCDAPDGGGARFWFELALADANAAERAG